MPDAPAKSEAADAKSQPAKAEKATGGGGGGGKLTPIFLALNSLLLAAVLAVVLLRPQGIGHKGSAAKPDEHAAPATAPNAEAEATAKEGEGHGKEGGDKENNAKGKKGGKEVPPGPMLQLSDFVIHLRDTDSEHYARMSFQIEVEDDKAKESVTARMPIIRDAFLLYLSDLSSNELRGGEAMAKVKGALTEKLTTAVPVGIRSLYITELVVQ